MLHQNTSQNKLSGLPAPHETWRKVPLYRDTPYYECMKLADLYREAGWTALVKLTTRRTFDGLQIGEVWVTWEGVK